MDILIVEICFDYHSTQGSKTLVAIDTIRPVTGRAKPAAAATAATALPTK